MCAICFTAAQVVPLGALYARAKFVSARERRAADDTAEPERVLRPHTEFDASVPSGSRGATASTVLPGGIERDDTAAGVDEPVLARR